MLLWKQIMQYCTYVTMETSKYIYTHTDLVNGFITILIHTMSYENIFLVTIL